MCLLKTNRFFDGKTFFSGLFGSSSNLFRTRLSESKTKITEPSLFVNMFFTRIAGNLFGRSSTSIISKSLIKSTAISHNVLRAPLQSPVISEQVIAFPGQSQPHMFSQIRTFRDKDVLKLRCNACYFKKLDDRWWVLCNKHPRHKQRAKVEDHKQQWIVTHITRTGSYRRKHFQYPHQDI